MLRRLPLSRIFCIFLDFLSGVLCGGSTFRGQKYKRTLTFKLIVVFSILLNVLKKTMVCAQDPLNPCSIFGQDRCRCTPDLHEFMCRGAGFTEVPDLPYSITKLDLTSNNITALNATSLSSFQHLEELVLSDNKLESIHSKTFARNIHIKRLILQNCGLKKIPTDAFKYLNKLQTLQIGNNAFGHIELEAFVSLPNLRSLRIDGNHLHRIPTEALATLKHLEVL